LFVCGFGVLLLGVANPPDASTLGMVAGVPVRVASLLLGIAALQGGVALLYRPELPRRVGGMGRVDMVGEAGPHDLDPR
jgi:hypothetical protein